MSVLSKIKNSKEQKQIAVSKAILDVIEKDGLNGVTHSKVSRKAGVSRSWIYEYIGKEKSSLIEYAAETLANQFARTDMALPKTKDQLDERLKEGIGFLFDSVEVSPGIVKIYYHMRGKKNPIAEVIRKYEKRWLDGATKSISSIFGVDQEQASMIAELILILRLGFAFRVASSEEPQLARSKAEKTFDLIHKLFTASI